MKLLELLEKTKSIRTLTVGDNMNDHYVFCEATRLCPEGPVPVLIPKKVMNVNGGAGHVAEQLQHLSQVSYTFFGPTSQKKRYMVGHHLVLRVDEDQAPPATDAQKIEGLAKHLKDSPGYNVIVLSDYNKGMLTTAFCEWIIGYARSVDIPVIVDPKGKNWDKYKGCDLICPNMQELKEWTGSALFPFMLLKAGAEGVSLFMPSGKIDYPATAKHVFDVTGAGDIVVAVAAALIGAGGTKVQAAKFANVVAGWSVGEVGTVVATREKLMELANETSDT